MLTVLLILAFADPQAIACDFLSIVELQHYFITGLVNRLVPDYMLCAKPLMTMRSMLTAILILLLIRRDVCPFLKIWQPPGLFGIRCVLVATHSMLSRADHLCRTGRLV